MLSASPTATTSISRRRDAARYANVSGKTVRCWIREGKLRRYRAGRLLRVKRSELDALMGAEAPATTERAEDIAARILGGR
ncbi:MAG: helix-turn-helix domain-containing protein [Myxococcota bacterium]